MDMETVNFALPRAMRQFVKNRVASGRYQNVSEYMRDLIRQDQERVAEEHLKELLLEGLNDPVSFEITPEYWERKRQELIDRYTPRPEADGRRGAKKKRTD